MSRFQIVITETTFEKRILGKGWEIGAGDNPEEYGYTPEIEKTVAVERKILEQDVAELDLVSVIKAINSID